MIDIRNIYLFIYHNHQLDTTSLDKEGNSIMKGCNMEVLNEEFARQEKQINLLVYYSLLKHLTLEKKIKIKNKK